MKICKCGRSKTTLFFSILSFFIFLAGSPYAAKGPGGGSGGGSGGGKPGTEAFGNNLSFPVIWAEGVTKVLRGTPGMLPDLRGEYWYQWGTNGVDPNITPASCPADPDEIDPAINPDGLNYCDDLVPGAVSKKAGEPSANDPLPLAKAYLQKDPDNTWQADSADWSVQGEVPVDWIDWGDNLESVDWYTSSQVRIEVVLFKGLSPAMTEYEMRHVSGWGINEAHGLTTTPALPASSQEVKFGPGNQATVYSPCARLTIQKLLVERENVGTALAWDVVNKVWTGTVIKEPILNQAVYEAADGSGYYNAEINVKGRIIYGYTWNVRQLNDITNGTAAGDYRITFSLDGQCPTVARNTNFNNAQIVVPLEEELVAAALAVETSSTEDGGATAQIDAANNLTYLDVRIIQRTGGGGGRR